MLKSTSYENAKEQNLGPLTLPAEAQGAAAYARANFKGDGKATLFTAYSTYDLNKPAAAATPGVFVFWSVDATGAYVRDAAMIDTTVGCVLPRKAAVADFNGDGKPDILVACHGYDGPPFPGEQMFVVESTASGVYRSRPFGPFTGFFHGAAAADLDRDGRIDVIATDGGQRPLRMFKNNGGGVFSEMPGVFPPSLASGYFTVEVLDLDGDGQLDVIAGGHEYEGVPTLFLKGDGTGKFLSVKQLPAAVGIGVVLDFVKFGSRLYVGRTNGGATGFYSKLGLQVVDLVSFTNVSVTSKDSLLFYWLTLFNGSVISDRIDRPL